MSETGTVRKIAFAAWTGTTPATQPAVPDLGGVVTWSTPWLKVLGGQPGSTDLGKLDKDKVGVKPFDDGLDIDPPNMQGRIDKLLFANAVESLSFSVYSANEATSELPNTAVKTAGVIEEGIAFLYKSMCVEISGVCVDYYPKVRVRITKQEGGIRDPWKIDFEAKVFGTTAIPSGRKRISFTTPA